MIEVENIDFIFPWLAPKLHPLNQHLNNVKNCLLVRALTQTKGFIQRRPFVSLFLSLSIAVGSLPFVAFGVFVGGSLLVTLFAALTALSGVVFLAIAWSLAILLPTLMIGGSVALCVYLPYWLASKILRSFKRFEDVVMRYTSRLWKSFGSPCDQIKATIADELQKDFAPANKEMRGEKFQGHMNEEYNVHNADRPEYTYYLSEEGYLYSPQRENYFYNHDCREDYRYDSDKSRRFRKIAFSRVRVLPRW